MLCDNLVNSRATDATNESSLYLSATTNEAPTRSDQVPTRATRVSRVKVFPGSTRLKAEQFDVFHTPLQTKGVE
jgi:hypothetical protein